MFIIEGTFEGGRMVKLFDGSGWTTIGPMARQYETPSEAQSMADGLHYADNGFDPVKAKATPSRFVVRDYHTGEGYTPPPFVNNRYILARQKGATNG